MRHSGEWRSVLESGLSEKTQALKAVDPQAMEKSPESAQSVPEGVALYDGPGRAPTGGRLGGRICD